MGHFSLSRQVRTACALGDSWVTAGKCSLPDFAITFAIARDNPKRPSTRWACPDQHLAPSQP